MSKKCIYTYIYIYQEKNVYIYKNVHIYIEHTRCTSRGSTPSIKASWTRQLKLPWREAGPHNHHDDQVDSDQ